MAKESGASSLAVSLPNGGGDVRGLGGSFVPDYNRGTGSYQLALQLPNGRAGFRPDLVLGYSSGGSNGAFGLGWSIGVPKIQRNGERGFLRYDDTDPFLLDDHGDLVEMADGSYRPAVDRLFAHILRLPGGGWEIRQRDNRVQRFGVDASARVFDPASPDRVLAWALQESEDPNGNLITYSYTRDSANLYVSGVAYAIYRIRFMYEVRPDVYGTARHGFDIQTRFRCRSIELHCDRLAPATLMRRYALAYVEPPETPLSLLHSITYSGVREVDGHQNVATFPALTFGYRQFDPQRRALRSFTVALGPVPPPVGPDDVELVDFTGDGLPDVLQLDGVRNRYWRNRGDGSWEPPLRIAIDPSNVQLGFNGATFADMDGNGTADLLVAEGPRPGYFPNLGNGAWGRFEAYRHAPSFLLSDPNTRQVDLDADGVIDLLRTARTGLFFYLNRGRAGWSNPVEVPRVHDTSVFPDVFFDDRHVLLGDMTGDGLADIVLVYSGTVWYWPYEGLGRWGRRRDMKSPPVFPRQNDPGRVFLTDVNGDGIADLVYVDFDSVTFWLNQFGNKFSAPVRIPYTPLTSGAQLRIADLLGSGTTGVVWSYTLSSRNRSNYKYLDFTGGVKPYLLTTIDNGCGKQTEIVYSTSSQFAGRDRAEGRTWHTFLPMPVQVVAEIMQRDLHSGSQTVTGIRYHNGLFDGIERRFAGFGEVEITEQGDAGAPGLRTTIHFDESTTEGLDETARALAVARWGKVLETTQQEAGKPDIEQSATTTWDASVAARGKDGRAVVVIHRTRNVTKRFGADGPLIVSHTFDFDAAGNIVRDRYEANGPTSLVKLTEMAYATDPQGEVLSAPSSIVEMREDRTVLREFRTYYDGDAFVGLPLGSITKGNVSRRSMRVLSTADFTAHYGSQGFTPESLGYRQETGAAWVDTGRYSYNARGSIGAVRGPLGEESRVEYDADDLFPIVLRNAANRESRFQWDSHAVQPAEVRDANGNSTTFAFDALGGVTKLAKPGDTLDDPSETVAYHLDASPPFVELTKKLFSAGGPRSLRRVFHDGDGQVLQTRTRTDAATVVVSPLRTYNGRGWLSQEGESAFVASPDFGPPPPSAVTSYTYDAFGRIVQVVYPDGHRDRTVNEPFRTLHFDANDTDDSPENVARGFFNTPKVHRYDGWGRMIAATELHDNLITTHSYEYNDNARLVGIRGPDGGTIVRQFYDMAGNRLRLSHRDAGERLFYCNAAGQTVRVVDAEANVIDREFDLLNRPTRTRVNGVDVETYSYDDIARPNQIGRLSGVIDASGTWEFDFDVRGRAVTRRLTNGGRTWALGHQYGPGDMIESITYPDGARVGYEYNVAGFLTSVPGFIDEVRYNPRGFRTSIGYPNRVRTLLDYDSGTHFLSRMRVVDSGGSVLQDLTYRRDAVGNVLEIDDGRAPSADSPNPRRFTYDGRYRLIQVAGGDAAGGVAPYTRPYSYDEATNFTTYPTHGGATIFYDPPGSNRIAGIQVGAVRQTLYRHSPNGHLVSMPERTSAFDAFGRLSSVQRADGRRVSYVYNVAGNRVWRIGIEAGQAKRTLYFAGFYEEDDDGSTRRHVLDATSPVAVESASGRTYLHGNDLGHITLMTDAAGNVVGRRDYHPFGELRSGDATNPDVAFGGKVFDEISGFYNFGSRYYAPEIGRFISPDPLLLMNPTLGVTNPQLHNLYAYANNNPMTFVDPYGLSLWGSIFGGLVGGIVGALVFVVSGGNVVAAGLVGGFAGGAVAGAIDGGVRGAVVGGLLGAASGVVGGLAFWGISALSGAIFGAAGQVITNSVIAGVVPGLTAIYGLIHGIDSGNWDILAGAAAGFLGAFIGTYIGDQIMMKNVYDDPNNSPRVKQIQREAQAMLKNKANFENTTYSVEHKPGADRLAFENNGHITFNESRMGNSYLDFRRTQAHELMHEYQEQTVPNFNQAWAAESRRVGQSLTENRFQVEAENFAMRFTNYTPYPFQVYSHAILPVLLVLAQPPAYEDRKRGEDKWKEILGA